MSTRLQDYEYDLPSELIAERPSARRDHARMLVVDRASGGLFHHRVKDLPDFFAPGDLAVMNNSKVFRARTFSDDGRIEILFIEEIRPKEWRCLVRPGRKMRPGDTCLLGGNQLEVLEVLPGGDRVLRCQEAVDFDLVGHVPLPPYIQREDDEEDEERYQCVYAEKTGSVAAPTAGLHFTPELLARIPHTFVTLHVGPGTFQPVKAEDLDHHIMHEERYEIPPSSVAAIKQAHRVLAVGTTVVRVLESQPSGPLAAATGSTRLFIRPPFPFQRTDRLLTNFHLPGSTLLMLVAAFGGFDLMHQAYRVAVEERYRFYSYGDCMLIL
jgi:S-adenosylmethionine:tRNA ribosyltransferase-isomerase